MADKTIVVSCPSLKGTSLVLRSMKAHERLGRMFRFDLALRSEDQSIKFEDVVGHPMSVQIALPNDGKRYFHGFVTRFAQVGGSEASAEYQVRLRPWLWFLTRTADCRIFPKEQEKQTVPDIIKSVFKEHEFTDIGDDLKESYKKRQHCVQYRETDFNFVMRLMEREGVYFYFKHEKDKHTLVLRDAKSAAIKVKGYEEIPYVPPGSDDSLESDHIFEWKVRHTVQPGMVALRDFDFELPTKTQNLEFKAAPSIGRTHPYADFEVFDYPGQYVDPADEAVEKDQRLNDEDLQGAYESFAEHRIEERHTQTERFEGRGNARGLQVGAEFELTGCTREDQNRKYLIVAATHEIETGTYESDEEGSTGMTYACAITGIDARQPFRSDSVTPKPVVQGPQTAIVVGKKNEEIWTDKYGRVRVQFHWDRYGGSDEQSSCWVRVAQIWAGKKWGGIYIPRMGQEVIVDFLEGDPDRPIITGSVYNGDNMPPYDLPDNQTQSGIKTRSTKEGTEENFNEIRFEDKKDEELVYVQAEKDYEKLVKNDRRRKIGNDETLEVGNNQTEKIGADKRLTIGKNHFENIEENAEIEVRKKQSVIVGDNMTISVGKNRALDVGENHTESVAKNKDVSVDKNMSRQVGGDYTVEVAKSHKEQVTKGYALEAKEIFTEAKDSIEIKVGKASIIMKKNGDIQIKGGKINIKGTGDVVIKGSKIGEN